MLIEGKHIGEGDLRQALRHIDPFYRDLEDMLEIRPLRVTLLRAGAFEGYSRDPRALMAGALAPPRVNASDQGIAALLGREACVEETAAA